MLPEKGGEFMAETELMQVRVDAAVRAEVDEICHALGLSTDEAINLFFHQILLHDGIPFPVQKPRPDGGVFAALDDADAIACGVLHTKSCANASDLIRTARGSNRCHRIKSQKRRKKATTTLLRRPKRGTTPRCSPASLTCTHRTASRAHRPRGSSFSFPMPISFFTLCPYNGKI